MSSSNDTTVHLRVSVEASQGSRKSMEDYTSVTIEPRRDRECFFAVFDGHGGHQAAFFARQNLWKTIQKQKDFYSSDPDEVGKAIKRAFVEIHTAMWKERGKHLKIYEKQNLKIYVYCARCCIIFIFMSFVEGSITCKLPEKCQDVRPLLLTPRPSKILQIVYNYY